MFGSRDPLMSPAPATPMTRPMDGRPRRLKRAGAKPQWIGAAFISPSYVFILGFFVLPLIMTAWMSLHNWPLLGQPRLIGLQNYRDLLTDTQFWTSMGFTILYTALVTVAIFAVAFPLALIANSGLKGAGIFRTVFFMPVVIGFAAASTLWLWLFNPDNGVIANILIRLHLVVDAPRPIENFWPALGMIILMVVWKTSGFTMVILLTGLQSIPNDVLEAARIDGAGPLQRFFLITLPLMRPSLALALILCVTSSMLAFDQFYIITQGGPQNSTISAVFSIYLASFTSYRLGYGAAMSMVLLCLLVAISSIQLAILRPQGDR